MTEGGVPPRPGGRPPAIWQAVFDGGWSRRAKRWASGALLLADGKEVESDLAALPAGATMNMGEFKGAAMALSLAILFRVPRLEILGDSMLVIRAARGEWRLSKPWLRPLLLDLSVLGREIPGGVSWTWHPRTAPLAGRADALCRNGVPGRELLLPRECLDTLCQAG